MLKIHESIASDGSAAAVFLRVDGAGLEIVDGAGGRAVPDGALDAVMKRFGQLLDAAAMLVHVASLTLPDGRRLRHVRHLARFDVIAKDYLVLDLDGEPRCALATTVAGALDHLSRSVPGGTTAVDDDDG